MKKVLLAVAVVAVVAAAGLGAWLAFGGEDETSVRGTCDQSAYELAVEDEDGQLEVSFELQAANPGETWQVLVEQDGQLLLEGIRTTDEDAELDLDAPADGEDGEEFTVTATPEGGEACIATVTR